MAESIAGVGYINPDRQHVLISVREPSLLNLQDEFFQVAITIGTAIELRAELNAFLAAHGVVAH